MSKGDELFALRERLLEYLYDEGAISARAPVSIEQAVAALNVAASDYDVVCSNLVKAELIEGPVVDDGPASYPEIWLTEKGVNNVLWRRILDDEVNVDILKERLSALIEVKQLYYRSLSQEEIEFAAKSPFSFGDKLLKREMDAIKAKIIDVDIEIAKIKQRIAMIDHD